MSDTLADLLQQIEWNEARSKRIEEKSICFVDKIRMERSGNSEIETFLQHYSLASPEGRALMTLAESLLRIRDSETADRLIAEKLAASDWTGLGEKNLFMRLAGIALKSAKTTLDLPVVRNFARPVVRRAMKEAVRHLGGQFVMGQTILEALNTGKELAASHGYRCSFDILGEGARTDEDAERYFESYKGALLEIGRHVDLTMPLEKRHGMSVKLSALHPRYHWTHAEHCVPVLVLRLLELSKMAAEQGIPLTVDAEESDRLEISLDIIRQVVEAQQNKNWGGLGIAVQAYDRRCLNVIDYVAGLSRATGQKLQIRLVKGAYWDGEIKRAQVAGWADYPVFQRKSQTDLSYLTAAQKLLKLRGTIYPMFATHNAHTAAAILDFAADDLTGFEFQRLHGMGAALGGILREDEQMPVTIYAPVGPYEDLLPYLVRRMLENGANVSFVANVRNDKVPARDILKDPIARVRDEKDPEPLPLPVSIYADRKNSFGPDLSRKQTRDQFFAGIPAKGSFEFPVLRLESEMVQAAQKSFATWRMFPALRRAIILEKAADLIEEETPRFMALLRDEAKKTFSDGVGEIREAADFCRYYAALGREEFVEDGVVLKSVTGEVNRLRLGGRGVFVCISPWNFPLAIFTGQVVAALMAGNSVIAKPAEQTPQIAAFAVSLLHKAGVPKDVLQLAVGDGKVGAELVGHSGIAGVAFTGSTEVAQIINRTLAAKDGPIVPLIAETGGQNAMVVDSTALPEQVVDDVILSAFGSAGQRCSALRVLYVQDDIADRVIHLLQGAMAKLQVGNPADISTDVGPVIDEEAQQNLLAHVGYLEGFARKIAEAPSPQGSNDTFVSPQVWEIDSLSQLKGEVFGPILHIIRYKAKNLSSVIKDVNGTGYGLTFGLHSRLSGRFDEISCAMRAGNIYINRSMIGAVVGVQPFGGMGLSGSGPKAGGPHYLHRFATEQTVSDNVMASGGNIELISLNLD
ncbi:MAG TPA: L-glutamate gamma-semialdehyde dehydrogenase [Alphaproteobacteria bacterium]|nr:L-glutamate gamma-semialdehyde dehydrogenase [Alphaproteobacteria bacterium]HNS44686.1 L-glutamate gamma-semialdehyde dehydrogenase [Alphaproteobacteria bacterium]